MTSLSVVYQNEVCLFQCQTVENMLADDELRFHYIQNFVPRQQHVYQLRRQNAVLSLSFMDSPGRRPMLASTDFSSDYCNTNNSHSISNSILDNILAGLPHYVHIVHLKFC